MLNAQAFIQANESKSITQMEQIYYQYIESRLNKYRYEPEIKSKKITMGWSILSVPDKMDQQKWAILSVSVLIHLDPFLSVLKWAAVYRD